jgi:hypothetical protein
MECPIKAQARVNIARKFFGCGDDGFQGSANISVAVPLAACQRPRIAPKKWKMGMQLLTKRHNPALLLTRVTSGFINLTPPL